MSGYAGEASDYGPGTEGFGLPRKIAEGGELVFHPGMEWTGGGWVSNPQDLVRWAKAVYEGRALAFPYLDELLSSGYRPQDLSEGKVYGLGVFVIDDAELGTRRLGHGGYFPGYNTSMYYYPEYGFAVALQVNTSVGSLRNVLDRELARVLLGFYSTPSASSD